MAITDRPDVDADKPWREVQAVRRFYASIPPDDEYLTGLMRPVMDDELRADAVVPRLRAAALHVSDAGDRYPLACRGFAVTLLRKVGRGNPAGRPVDPDAGKKGQRFTISAEDSAEKARFETAASAAGLSLSAWALSVLRAAIADETQGE